MNRLFFFLLFARLHFILLSYSIVHSKRLAFNIIFIILHSQFHSSKFPIYLSRLGSLLLIRTVVYLCALALSIFSLQTYAIINSSFRCLSNGIQYPACCSFFLVKYHCPLCEELTIEICMNTSNLWLRIMHNEYWLDWLHWETSTTTTTQFLWLSERMNTLWALWAPQIGNTHLVFGFWLHCAFNVLLNAKTVFSVKYFIRALCVVCTHILLLIEWAAHRDFGVSFSFFPQELATGNDIEPLIKDVQHGAWKQIHCQETWK